ncbi:hypothetical protein WA026_012746 [Henosepilachna vigintioctopunctata]|uniref:DDE Tnp4 domain-containing protein n=1 Tax=Henosepilachna vigintioctopunctata TaxID=420089 RepID=A0AAW1U5X7_9CUCU
MDIKIRKKWLKAMKRLDPFGDKSKVNCCEDYFDIENDMENYIEYKLVGGKLQLKKGIVPHKFTCQEESNDKPERSTVKKPNLTKYFEKKSQVQTKNPFLRAPKNPKVVFVTCCPGGPVIEDPLSFGNNNQSLEISKKHKAVQEKLKNKVIHNCIPRNVIITLKKIRLHQPNAILGLDFCLETSTVTKIFRDTAPALASALNSLVMVIEHHCGILQALPKGAAVLADRGFKNIAHLLQHNGNTLIRPPSVSY